ncbi:acyltransferase [Prevotella sp.]|mgnify:FL=1|uniref:acyltransferase n=1 Tax=Prevotella sp. TaxID=59823 RepID=UPI002ABDB99D|nr:acyltransferase [Prevotella sp.]
METVTAKQRIIYLDFLKVIAIFLMVANHCVDNVTPAERALPWYNLWGSVYNSFTRPAIPLFMMVTGILLLPTKMDMGSFYKKRLSRVLIPFLVWSVLYNLFPWFTGLLNCDPETIHVFFKWADTTQAFGDAMRNILMIPFNFSAFAVQMWYVYLLIGIYLYIPVFSAWVEKSDKRSQRIFLAIWAVSLFVPYLRNYLTENLFGECSWNEFGLFYYFAGFSGYMLLGYHLVKYPLQMSKVSKYALAAIAFAIGYAVTLIGFKNATAVEGQSEAMVELFFTYCSPNVALMTFAVFLIAKDLRFENKRVNRFISQFSICTFGIWMCHYFFVGPVFLLFKSCEMPVLLKVFLENILVLLASFALVYLVRSTGTFGKKIMG